MSDQLPAHQFGAIYDQQNGPIEIRQLPIPHFGSDELLVKVDFI